ncbi:MAG TPA: histidine kinase dimerization/phospho-acceptor domain-containing protein, partial [Pyrinomonadaceae bacterium]|nr:histidine kinase dimerization/phospho-acceptor domain-containing protein [Pyrinomonadaceae bacterium]
MSLRFKFPFFLCVALVLGVVAGLIWGSSLGLALALTLLAGAGLASLVVDKKQRAATDAQPALDHRGEATPVTDASAATLLEAMMNAMREGMLVLDKELRVVASNRAARQIFRDLEEARAPRRLSDLTRNPSIHSAFQASLSGNQLSETKVEMQGAGGPIYDLRVVPLRLNDEANSRGAMGVFFNITRLERLERVRQEFLSNVSHELRTPLTAIIAFVETLEDGALTDDESNRRFLSIIRRNAERMHNLIDDILELSAIEAGTVQVEPAPVHLQHLVNDVLTALASRAEARTVELRNETPADAIVRADPRRLEQMLSNLIHNAIKFNRAQGSVTVRHERREER